MLPTDVWAHRKAMLRDTQLGSYLKQLREQRGWSVRQLGAKVGYSGSYISQMETGARRVTVERLWALVKTLDGNMRHALHLLALDAGVPSEALERHNLQSAEVAEKHR